MIGSSIVGCKGKLRYTKEDLLKELATKYQLIQYVRPENFSLEQREAIAVSLIYKLFLLENMGIWNTKDLINVLKPTHSLWLRLLAFSPLKAWGVNALKE